MCASIRSPSLKTSAARMSPPKMSCTTRQVTSHCPRDGFSGVQPSSASAVSRLQLARMASFDLRQRVHRLDATAEPQLSSRHAPRHPHRCARRRVDAPGRPTRRRRGASASHLRHRTPSTGTTRYRRCRRRPPRQEATSRSARAEVSVTDGGDLTSTVSPRSLRACLNSDAPGRNRTCDLSLRRRTLYPLSYGRRGEVQVRGLSAYEDRHRRRPDLRTLSGGDALSPELRAPGRGSVYAVSAYEDRHGRRPDLRTLSGGERSIP